MHILVTGGAGYIGSHSCLELLQAGYDLVVVDNLCNSKREALRRVERLTGKTVHFHQIDLRSEAELDQIFRQYDFEAVIHFAGLKAVGESVKIPVEYYHNNITATLILLKMMARYAVKNIVFSSSATVYGDPHTVPITEDFPTQTANPYGRTKLFIEEILRDVYQSDREWNIILLRYFNPVGAHLSGEIGEDPNGIPNNLFPYISQVAVGKLKQLPIYGNDYPTPDGTGVRDYIHVVDLARGHLKALEKLRSKPGLAIYNLGTGQGYSVLQIVKAFEEASGKRIPYRVVARRPGDIAVCYADASLAERELGWTARKGMDEMCADTWNWQSRNPNGYE